ncbi:MAG TPA: hypothetical protein PK228_18765 [Saprospiraceae bacterium]|nr:hypothetical protein [Saprospiraceae bacterium]
MKNVHRFLTTVFAIGFTVAATAQTEFTPVDYMRQALANAIARGLADERVSDLGFQKDECILGGYILAGQSINYTVTLNCDTKYGFVGGGDDDVADLDIHLYNSKGVEVAKDAKTNNYPVAIYTPVLTGSYTVKVKMFSTRTRGSFAGLIIKSDDGYNIPITLLAGAVTNLTSLIEKLYKPPVKRMGFMNGHWVLYGCVLNEGRSKTLPKIPLSPSKLNAIIATGDQNVSDVDLFLYDSNEKLLEEHKGPEKHAAVVYEGSSGTTYQLKMKNARSSEDRSLIMSAILEVE